MILSRVLLHPLLLAAALAPTSLLSQTKTETTIDRLTGAATAIIPRTAHLEKVATCCEWLEGPAWAPDGRLFVSDTDLNEILAVSSDGKVRTFKKPSGLTDPSFPW